MVTVRLDLRYDGTDFHGYAAQPAVRTVQGELDEALAKIFGPVSTVVAGRTDAGVHAHHQVVSFSIDGPLDPEATNRRLNKLLPPDVAVIAVAATADEFSARFSAITRTYRYGVLVDSIPDPLRRRTLWHVPGPLDAFAMNQAARHFVGEHDFASFCRKSEGRTTERTVLAARWEEPSDGELWFQISGNAFCHQMVRSIVAVCVDVGRGKLAPGAIPEILAARDRNAARGAAPPHGLILWNVSY